MKNKVLLSFPNYQTISLEFLSTISIELPGCYFTSRKLENENGDIISYYPRTGNFLLYNSFMPIITVKTATSSSKLILSIAGKQSRMVRLILSFFYVILGLLQCFLIKTYFDGLLENLFVGFIPIIIFTFLFILSTIIKRVAINAFAEKYRAQIERLISTKETSYKLMG